MKDNYFKELKELGSKIWDYSEIKFKEYKSVDSMVKLLKEEGFNVEENLAGIPTAFSASYGSGKPVIGILGEFDALSGMSQVENSYEKQSVEGRENGHGCGHHLLGVAGIGAVLNVRDYLRENNREGTIVYYGCPGEEGGSGKAFMVKNGVFDGVDIALTWHPYNVNAVMSGSMLANIQVVVNFKGISSHAAASPNLGRSALDALEIVNIGVNFLREHIKDEERIHYAITDTGGISPNVVQASASGLYLIRAKTTEDVKKLYERFIKIVKGAALITETEYEIVFDKACSHVVPNTVLEKLIYSSFKKVGIPNYSEEDEKIASEYRKTFTEDDVKGEMLLGLAEDPVELLEYLNENVLFKRLQEYTHSEKTFMGSTDVGDVSNVVPTAQAMVACFAIGTPGHSWQEVSQGKTDYAFKGMQTAADVMGESAITVFENPNIITEAKEELAKRQNYKAFESPIPDGAKPHIE